MSVPEIVPDEKDKYIVELTERIKSNSSVICNYQSKLTELEKSLSESNYKIAKLLTKNSELRKEITFLNQEMKSIYSAYKKHKGIEI
jgi:peptidoglycan hydrolase CwlO-like protein